MSAGSNIVLADAKTTPVSHTFTWAGNDAKGISHWVDRSQGTPIGDWRISMSVREPIRRNKPGQLLQATGVYRVEVTLAEPILEVLTPATFNGVQAAPTVSYIPRAQVVLFMPERSSLVDRASLTKMLGNLLLHAQATEAAVNLDLPR